MKIEIDTNALTLLDREILVAVVETINATPAGEDTTPAEPTPAEAPKPAPAKATKAPAKAAAAPKIAAVPDPVETETPTSEEAGAGGEDEDLLGGAPTMADAVATATKLVSSGKQAEVKAALEKVGSKRVSEMAVEDIPAFLAALPSA